MRKWVKHRTVWGNTYYESVTEAIRGHAMFWFHIDPLELCRTKNFPSLQWHIITQKPTCPKPPGVWPSLCINRLGFSYWWKLSTPRKFCRNSTNCWVAGSWGNGCSLSEDAGQLMNVETHFTQCWLRISDRASRSSSSCPSRPASFERTAHDGWGGFWRYNSDECCLFGFGTKVWSFPGLVIRTSWGSSWGGLRISI